MKHAKRRIAALEAALDDLQAEVAHLAARVALLEAEPPPAPAPPPLPYPVTIAVTHNGATLGLGGVRG